MPTIRDIYNILFDFAPAYMKMDWDNVGGSCAENSTQRSTEFSSRSIR